MYDEEEKITLDRKAFKALASDTRVNILKSLSQRRKTLSELSTQFGMSVSTIKEHLDNLSSSDLVVQKDDGHKWKYYELTSKGKAVLYPSDKRIWVMLSLSGLALLLTGFDYFSRFLGFGSRLAEESGAPLLKSGQDMVGPLASGAQGGAEATSPLQAAASLPLIHIIAFIVFAVVLGVSLGLLIASRMKKT
jgi:DNA-binding transcriptional ArsR family regulator